MANLNFTLDNLYRQAFPDLAAKPLVQLDGARDRALSQLDRALGDGYTLPQASPPFLLDVPGIPVVQVQSETALSYLGTPVFHPITFQAGQYKALGIGDKQGQVLAVQMTDWALPHTATAEFNQAKTIAKSNPNATYGSVKELWAFQDWDITIRGLILDNGTNAFPDQEVRKLLAWHKLTDSIEVVGAMFTYLGIKRLVIDKLNISQVSGMPNVVPFQMQCSSDEAKELTILSNRF